MSSFPFVRARVRAVSVIVFCSFSVAAALVWTTHQQAVAPSHSLRTRPSFANLFDKTSVSPNAATILVNSTADVANAADGLCTLREAIAAANNNVASGAVAGECAAGSSSGSDTIDLTGVSGTIAISTALPAISSNTIVNGPGAAVLTIQKTGNFSAIGINSPAIVSIAGLKLQGIGNPQIGVPGNYGISSGGTLNLSNCTVTGFGTGVTNGQNTMTISNCLITANTAGSGISVGQGTVNLVNSVVSNNDSHGAFGPGIDNSFGVLNVTNSTITGNKGHYAIDIGPSAKGTIINTTISNNPNGGLINNGTLTMTGGLVTGNANHGMILASTSLVNGVTITNNSANGTNDNGGGGLFLGLGVTLMNCLIANNSTDGFGGGIRNGGGTATIINTTIT